MKGRTRLAFYAPMKPPDHPVPSGDRQIARLTLTALERAGFAPRLVSRLRVLDVASGRIVTADTDGAIWARGLFQPVWSPACSIHLDRSRCSLRVWRLAVAFSMALARLCDGETRRRLGMDSDMNQSSRITNHCQKRHVACCVDSDRRRWPKGGHVSACPSSPPLLAAFRDRRRCVLWRV